MSLQKIVSWAGFTTMRMGCFFFLWALSARGVRGVEPLEQMHTYCLVGSLVSGDVRPVAIRVPEFNDGAVHVFENHCIMLSDGWDLMRMLKMNVLFATEVGVKVSVPQADPKEPRSWVHLNSSPLKLHIVGEDDGSKMLSLLRDIVVTFQKSSGLHVHFEPPCLASLSYHRQKPEDVVSLMLAEGDEERVKGLALSVTSELFASSLEAAISGRKPHDASEGWRLVLEATFGRDDVQFLKYDPALNVVIVKATDVWMDSFMMLWEGR